MPYNAWSVVFGETPSATKWGYLGTNDAGFRDGSNFAITTEKCIPLLAVNNPYKASAHSSGTTTISAGATGTKINLATEDYDNNSNFTGSRYTVPVSGYYDISGAIKMVTGASDTLAECAIYVDGSAVKRGSRNYVSVGSQTIISQVSGIIYLTAGSYVELWGFCTNANAVAQSSVDTRLDIHCLSIG